MEIGATPVTPAEGLLRRIQFQVILARSEELSEKNWRLELCSPFWRAYVNECDGAYLDHAGGRMEMRRDALYLIPAGTPFRTGLVRPLRQNYIHFDFMGIPPRLGRELFPEPLAVDLTPLLEVLCREWREALLSRKQAGLPLLALSGAFVHATMARLLVEMPGRQRACLRWLEGSSEIGPALRCIEQRLREPPENAELARLCHASVAHFIRKFHLAVGMPPAQYSRQRRIAVATQMLHEARLSLDDIAESTGFADRFHLSRVFREQIGVPPAKYRRIHGVK